MSVCPGESCPACGRTLDGPAQQPVCGGCRISADASRRLWLAVDDFQPQGFDLDAVARIDDLERQGHFWIRERLRLIDRLLAQLQRAARGGWAAALELGCGAGSSLPLLEARAKRVVAVDGHRMLLQRALATSRRATLLQADVTRTGLATGSFDLITAFDVLEHVDADAFLTEARRVAADGAKLLISVPAFPALWSEMDTRAGHRCRYRWRQLEAELGRNGWRPLGHTHFQFLLFPVVYASRHLGRSLSRGIERRPPVAVDRLLRLINRLEVSLFARVCLPFGSSLFAWASVDH